MVLAATSAPVGLLRNRLVQIRQRIARGLVTDTAELMQVAQAIEAVRS